MVWPLSAALGFVLLIAHPHASSARLASSGRRAPLTPEMDFPVFQFLRNKQVHARTGAWALKGVPTHYEASGCKKVNKVYDKIDNTAGSTSMSVSRCFAFCSSRKGVSYFGIAEGNKCWCGAAFDGADTDSSNCDKNCPGNPDQKCGGIIGTNVYVMIDCTNATAAEKAQEQHEKTQALLSSYGSWNGETCGQASDNVLQIDDKGSISGKLDTCKLACWLGKNAEQCHGFTYDSLQSKCTFHYDVSAGDVKKSKTSACYFKMV